MVNISSDRTDTEKSIVHVCDYLVNNGGYVSDNIEIIDTNGQTSVFAHNHSEADYAFKVNHDLLIPFDNFDLDIEGGDIVIAHDDRNNNEQHLALLALMLNHYNVSGKFRAHMAEHPVTFFHDTPEVIQHLLNAREGKDIKVTSRLIGRNDFHDELALLTFFKSRSLNCRLYNKQAPYSGVLLAGLELMRHHIRGANFDNIYNETHPKLCAKAGMPIDGSKECFMNYGRHDALDTYLHFGFVDENVKFIRSVPLKIDLDGVGIISIRGFNTVVPVKDIPEHLQDLSFYFPKMNFDHTHNIAELSHIFIPQENARYSMRRVLEYIIQRLVPDISESDCLQAIGIAENQIIEANIKHTDELEQIIAKTGKNLSEPHPIIILRNKNREKLEKYISLANA